MTRAGYVELSGSRPDQPRIWGTVKACDGASVTVQGLGRLASVGNRVSIATPGGGVEGEVVALDGDRTIVLLYGTAEGLATGQRAWLDGATEAQPSRAWLGRVISAFGTPMDGLGPLDEAPRAAKAAQDARGLRRGLGPRLFTGLATFDTLLPLCRGQRMGVFAGSGVGKSRLMTTLAQRLDADVTVVGLVGERAREVGEFAAALAPEHRARTVIVAATAQESALVRRRAADLALATAERFRDDGAHVLCMIDSLTRFAEAHREIALAAGEPPSLRAYPPSTAPALSRLCERAGPGREGIEDGDITAVFTVLVAGSDMDEPVADMVRGVLDGHVILDRAIAERGRFPAIDLRRSVSRSAPAAWTEEEAEIAARARALIARYEEARPMLQAGLYSEGTDAVLDEAIARWPDLDGFVGAPSPGTSTEESFEALKTIAGMDQQQPNQATARRPRR